MQIPYEYTIALAENAADNGVEIRIRRQVEDIAKSDDGLFEIDVGESGVLRHLRAFIEHLAANASAVAATRKTLMFLLVVSY